MPVIPFRSARSGDARWIRWVNASIACGLAVASGDAAVAGDPLFAALQVTHVTDGGQAPAFELPTADGQTVALAGLEGKIVLLNFWATWCPPCREEMPSMERLHQEFKAQGLAVLAVNIQESPKQVAPFMRAFRLTFPALLDSEMKVTALYQVRGLPVTYLIDRTGRLIGQAVGARDWASPAARALVRALLAAGRARR